MGNAAHLISYLPSRYKNADGNLYRLRKSHPALHVRVVSGKTTLREAVVEIFSDKHVAGGSDLPLQFSDLALDSPVLLLSLRTDPCTEPEACKFRLGRASGRKPFRNTNIGVSGPIARPMKPAIFPSR
ncbi:MAG: hypothetical protein LV481_12180 [Methylacidiphilales bacterium]|nr:hypothetical protein [Candidatus Methylacidiphilales bacterium]